MTSVKPYAAALLAVAISSTVSAEQTEEIVVTATRTEVPVTASLAPVTVMTAVDIEKLQVRDVPELVARFTGVDVVQRGGRGANSSAFIRGTNSGHLLVIVDGVRVGSATLGTSSLEYIDPAAIERIELVRGPRSSLYGSDAIGGILQIFTRKAEREGVTAAVKFGYGAHNEQQARASAGWKGEDSTVNIIASRTSTDGFDRTFATSNGNGDKDAYQANRLSLSASHAMAEDWLIDINGTYQEGESDTDNAYCFIDCRPYSTFENASIDMGLKAQLSANWVSQLRTGFAQDNTQQADHIRGVAEQMWGGTNRFETERNSLSWQNDLSVNDVGVVTLGADFYRDKVGSNNVEYEIDSRDNSALFGQYQLRVDGHSWVAAARADDNEQFGRKSTGSITYGFDVSEGWNLIASYGTAFKAPSFNDLYWPFQGNAALAPESSRNLEVGAKYQEGALFFAVNAFENKVEDLIAWAPDALGDWYPFNVNEAEIQGLEAELKQDFDGWLLAVNYTVLDTEDKDTGNQLANRAEQLFNADISRVLGDFTLGLDVEARSSRFADAANTQKLAGYGVLNLRAAWAITRQLQVDAKIGNVLDKHYTVVENFREDGVNAYASVTYQF